MESEIGKSPSFSRSLLDPWHEPPQQNTQYPTSSSKTVQIYFSWCDWSLLPYSNGWYLSFERLAFNFILYQVKVIVFRLTIKNLWRVICGFVGELRIGFLSCSLCLPGSITWIAHTFWCWQREKDNSFASKEASQIAYTLLGNLVPAQIFLLVRQLSGNSHIFRGIGSFQPWNICRYIFSSVMEAAIFFIT